MLIKGVTLVIYPLLALMKDQYRRLCEKGFSPVILMGGQTKEERDIIKLKLETGQSSFIISNPEILLVLQKENFFKNIKICHIVIDDAHCVSEWGESFWPSYLEIGSVIENIKNTSACACVTAFTATASEQVMEKIRKYIFANNYVHEIASNPDRPNIAYSAKGAVLKDIAVRDLLLSHKKPLIVFCSSRIRTEKLAAKLSFSLKEMGVSFYDKIKFYHAGLNKEEKTAVENWFMESEDAVLIATCAYGMGMDKASVRTVIHRDCSPSVEAYLQETGRAGREGKPSAAILLWGPEDKKSLFNAKKETEKERLSVLLEYARNTEKCRRNALLTMLIKEEAAFENVAAPCCDVCERKAQNSVREEDALKSFFKRNKLRYSITEAAKILAMSKNHFWNEEEAKTAINYFIAENKLKKTQSFLWKNVLSWNK
jgi:ATP-dependent DNA helicase RecQ